MELLYDFRVAPLVMRAGRDHSTLVAGDDERNPAAALETDLHDGQGPGGAREEEKR